MPPDDVEPRLRTLETATAVMEKSMEAIERALSEIKATIAAFLDKAQLALAIEGKVDRLEADRDELMRKTNAAFKLIDTHKQEFERMRAEHQVCQKRMNRGSSWLQERLTRVVDAGMIAVIVWLLTMWKAH